MTTGGVLFVLLIVFIWVVWRLCCKKPALMTPEEKAKKLAAAKRLQEEIRRVHSIDEVNKQTNKQTKISHSIFFNCS
jgi:hypothetical protein